MVMGARMSGNQYRISVRDEDGQTIVDNLSVEGEDVTIADAIAIERHSERMKFKVAQWQKVHNRRDLKDWWVLSPARILKTPMKFDVLVDQFSI
jgi:hypothetical protein